MKVKEFLPQNITHKPDICFVKFRQYRLGKAKLKKSLWIIPNPFQKVATEFQDLYLVEFSTD